MKASDIMTSPVITVEPQTPVRTIVARLLKHRISAVPVVEDGRLVGLISEADLLHRHEIGTDRNAPPDRWWLQLFSADRSIPDYIKSHAGRARDIMTREIVSVARDTPVAEIATLLEARGIKRVPVLEAGQLVGIVSRADLIHALAATGRPGKAAAPVTDEAIRGRLLAELERQPWWRRGASNVTVTGGVVRYAGVIESEDERDAARVAAQTISGVRRVEDRRVVIRDLPSMG
jgi:CBS domain-containing protein